MMQQLAGLADRRARQMIFATIVSVAAGALGAGVAVAAAGRSLIPARPAREAG